MVRTARIVQKIINAHKYKWFDISPHSIWLPFHFQRFCNFFFVFRCVQLNHSKFMCVYDVWHNTSRCDLEKKIHADNTESHVTSHSQLNIMRWTGKDLNFGIYRDIIRKNIYQTINKNHSEWCNTISLQLYSSHGAFFDAQQNKKVFLSRPKVWNRRSGRR